MTLEKLYNIIISRKKTMLEGSYVASLFRDGDDQIIQKVGEEAVEVVIAAKNENRERLISEIADLTFHTLVLLAAKNIKLPEILTDLEKRHSLKNK